jgi:hypothetical protein
MIYSLNEARNAEEYRAEKAASEEDEQDKKDKQYDNRYRGKNKDVLYLFTQKTRADGHKDAYYTAAVGSHDRNYDKYENKTYHKPDYEDAARYYAATEVADRNTRSSKERDEIRDAANRNMRRHPERWDGDKPVRPKSESTVFDNIEIV